MSMCLMLQYDTERKEYDLNKIKLALKIWSDMEHEIPLRSFSEIVYM